MPNECSMFFSMVYSPNTVDNYAGNQNQNVQIAGILRLSTNVTCSLTLSYV